MEFPSQQPVYVYQYEKKEDREEGGGRWTYSPRGDHSNMQQPASALPNLRIYPKRRFRICSPNYHYVLTLKVRLLQIGIQSLCSLVTFSLQMADETCFSLSGGLYLIEVVHKFSIQVPGDRGAALKHQSDAVVQQLAVLTLEIQKQN
ncbi:uncharacterized protein LOC122278129 [Carya illinoinensis]|uniref:uncharacterized protein LOC122278129 n=1 Tax=Carya illinoinensis TaxID=32201 RepID=UPI001C726999|nr:uncharacterized protein LOC122278129 [Carya illinoinensis]